MASCSVSSVFSEASLKPAALLTEQWHTKKVLHGLIGGEIAAHLALTSPLKKSRPPDFDPRSACKNAAFSLRGDFFNGLLEAA